jgi:hypothetical protein
MSGIMRIALALLIAIAGLSPVSLRPASAPVSAGPGLIVNEDGRWIPVSKGVEYRNIALQRGEGNQPIELKLLRFATQFVVPRVLRSVQFQLKGTNAKTFVEKTGAIAAINANYFDEQGKPLAFLKAAGRPVNSRISTSLLYSGIFGVKDQRPMINQRDGFAPEDVDEGVQSGPLLLFDGTPQPVSALPNRASRRALIGIDTEQRIVVAATDTFAGGLLWAEIQEIFSAPAWHIKTKELLNLDGGGSAQLYAKTGRFEMLVPGTSEVPVAIGFFRKTNP